jgi:hypothetical protein
MDDGETFVMLTLLAIMLLHCKAGVVRFQGLKSRHSSTALRNRIPITGLRQQQHRSFLYSLKRKV